MRALISSGKQKSALDQAKDIHKLYASPASETLLLDAYAARIESLMEQGLGAEATALVKLVSERFPAAKDRMAALDLANLAQSGKLADLLAPFNDPALPPERRAALEQIIQERVIDPGLMAGCPVLPEGHPLRQAATALDRAFRAVTSGPVPEEALALPEVSRRSPLAPWKMLVAAIAAFYRKDAESCSRYLDAIPPASAPARLIPVLQSIQNRNGQPLTKAGKDLIAQVKGNADALKEAARKLDEELEQGSEEDILRAIRRVAAECRQTAPSHLERLKQYIDVRAKIEHVNEDRTRSAMGGAALEDANYCLMSAKIFERVSNISFAALAWYEFQKMAVVDRWFPAKGPEVAAIYVHIAQLLRDVPPWDQHFIESLRKQVKERGDDPFFLNRQELYERASTIDPHPSVFNEWLHDPDVKGNAGEKVAMKWRQARPRDIEPVLHLISTYEKRKAFPTALQHLADAEQIDGVNPEVRRARLRLMSAHFLKQIQLKKLPAAALKNLEAIAALPQTQQGDRPAFVLALRYILAKKTDFLAEAQRRRVEIEHLLGSPAAASLLIYNVARACKREATEHPEMPKDDRTALPAALARIAALGRDVELSIRAPFSWVEQASKQFAKVRQSLTIPQLRDLGEFALDYVLVPFGYTISTEGLTRGAAAEAEFLFLRARVLRRDYRHRAMVCALAAAAIARQRQEFQLSSKAIEFLDEGFRQDVNGLEPAQIAQVLKTEKAETALPKAGKKGPTYNDLIRKACNCADCRRARGEGYAFFDPEEEDMFDDDFDDEDEDGFDDENPFDQMGFNFPPGLKIPKGIPPELAKLLLASMMEGMARGETPNETIARIEREMNLDLPGPKRGKKKK